ncbi:3-dehydroquinate dehydratase (3-dehydroquinase) [Dispira parvispora]|uniref:Pentafunctional AROM polypeptide n=1 Tax=Dispira parvispora TaxID=1520584 RepID=A0A9W8B0D0_9FUNG|nr:3-dehydroquinate dehydratase (3-dehydroquinase) [Dispira parvispora]
MATQPPKACTSLTSPPRDVIKIPILGRESIIVGFHLVDYIVCDLLATLKVSHYVLVSDQNLKPLYVEKFQRAFAKYTASLEGDGQPIPRLLTYILPPGEQTKSREQKAALEDFMLAEACTRDTCMLALGGGVIGDLVGYVAATFMRGVPLVQIPTSLLAMVDSSIGGKTAIDTPRGKNLVGAFWQPHRIFIDLHFLSSLPEREFCNGMAEVVKTATIWSEDDFSVLENHAAEIRAAVLDSSSSTDGYSIDTPPGALESNRTEPQRLLMRVVMGSAKVKAEVVSADERESGLRGLLNFGHTVGHAIEALLSPQLLHGECVAVGMVLESEIARNLGYLQQVALSRLVGCIRAYGLPVTLHDKLVAQRTNHATVKVADLMDVMRVDKKNVGSVKRLALPCRIGKTVDTKAIPVADDVIATVISPGVQVQSAVESGILPLGGGRETVVTVPGSKSISNRALVLAALGSGTCRLKNLLFSDDTQVMLNALQELGGCQYKWEDGGNTLVVTGSGGQFHIPDKELYLGNAGTAARFLTTLVTLVPASSDKADPEHPTATILTGNARMKQRPIGPLVEALRANGTSIEYQESEGCLPLRVTPVPKRLPGGKIQLAASISSQYVSSILLCAPYASSDITLELTGGKVISQPYIDMTVAMMRSFGVTVNRLADNTYHIPRGVYQSPSEYMVESDASSATYPLAVAAITGSCCSIRNIGRASLQGDSRFAVDVLRPMGCIVTQTETTTTVQGPLVGNLRPLPHVDMEPMTDAFLTASVLAAVAHTTTDGNEGPITRITGIANQRVKECNRIAVMVEELGKFGVQASELPDGIQIVGQQLDTLRGSAEGVDCHDDHRVAMSFSVLGCVVPQGTNIRERKCVEKTWPSWWDTLEHQLGVSLKGFDVNAVQSSMKSLLTGTPPATIVLIGMRGSGKTRLGRDAARALGRTFIDMDQYFEHELKQSVREVVQHDGWESFRTLEAQLLAKVLRDHPKETVVACGGGIIETPQGREVLNQYIQTLHSQGQIAPVVHLMSNIDHVVDYLSQDETRPAYGEDIRGVWERRLPHYRALATYEFPIYLPAARQEVSSATQTPSSVGALDITKWAYVQRDFTQFLSTIDGSAGVCQKNAPLPEFFVSLTLPDVQVAHDRLLRIVEGAGAVELRVDLLQQHPDQPAEALPLEYIAQQIGCLRYHLPAGFPIIYTVRTQSQGGRFPDDQPSKYWELLHKGVQWGCEYIDVEVTRNQPLQESALQMFMQQKGHATVIASWHDPQGKVPWQSERMEQMYRAAESFGDIIKLVSFAHTFEDNAALQSFTYAHRCGSGTNVKGKHKPLIALNMGPRGQQSRVMCPYLAPVTHSELPGKAAPGQLSIAEINQARSLLGMVVPEKYYLLGTPIAHSMSPLLHNTGFRTLGLPHHYSLAETDNPETMLESFKRDGSSFGGASVTIPLKETVMPYLSQLTPEAKMIGAVNTVWVEPCGNDSTTPNLWGDNTDWKGIVDCINRAKETQAVSSATDPSKSVALVVGAGGTAKAALFALYSMQFAKVYLFNRTPSRAQELKSILPYDLNVQVVDSLTAPELVANPPQVIISTVPATNFTLDIPASLFAGQTAVPGIALDMAYKPYRTPLLEAAEQHGWATIPGVEVLIDQGLHQFRRWTNLPAPSEVMRTTVRKAYGV